MMAVLNGRLPDTMLADLPWPEASRFRLRPEAAAAAGRMAAAFERDLGYPLRLTDAYRTLAVQFTLRVAKGVFAATPGTSVHGLGLAMDEASGVNVESSAGHKWMDAHAWTFGWINPAWAQDYNPSNGQHEPWHWEYHVELDDSARTPTPAPAATAAPTQEVPDMDDNDKRIASEANRNAFAALGFSMQARDEGRLVAIDQFYLSLLGRPASTADIAAQTGGLASGMSLAQIRANIAGSPEALARR